MPADMVIMYREGLAELLAEDRIVPDAASREIHRRPEPRDLSCKRQLTHSNDRCGRCSQVLESNDDSHPGRFSPGW
jgi:hypothetical protein